ncbi:MarR family winged helix-turn-helix transcriptional regulator [Umezawaea tangerina]
MTRTHQQIGLSVKRLQARHHRMANARLAPLDISLVQWDALRHIAANPEASLHDLALLTFQTDQSFGALASRMVDRGLIERVPGPGRAIRHRLTAKGDELRVAGGALMDDVLAESFAPLTPEQLQTFGELLAILLEAGPQD